MISESGRVIFFDIPKTGGESLRHAMLRLYPDAHGRHHSVRNWLCDFSFCSRVGSDQLRDFAKFAFVREPFDKLRSLYQWSRVRKYTLDQFVLDVKNGVRNQYAGSQHRPQVEWLRDADGVQRVDTIGRFESLRADWDSICDGLGVGRAPLVHSNASIPKPDEQYSEESLDIIREMYKEDFETFGYSMEAPLPTEEKV